MNCLNDEELQVLNESREPKEAPKLPDYIKPQPGKPGKLLWFSGPPGAGKSTSAALLARTHGYVYYEGDCLFTWSNPYIDPSIEEPSMAQSDQKLLKACFYSCSIICITYFIYLRALAMKQSKSMKKQMQATK